MFVGGTSSPFAELRVCQMNHLDGEDTERMSGKWYLVLDVSPIHLLYSVNNGNIVKCKRQRRYAFDVWPHADKPTVQIILWKDANDWSSRWGMVQYTKYLLSPSSGTNEDHFTRISPVFYPKEKGSLQQDNLHIHSQQIHNHWMMALQMSIQYLSATETTSITMSTI